MENVQKMSVWFSHQRQETSETEPKTTGKEQKSHKMAKSLRVCQCKYVSSCDEMKILLDTGMIQNYSFDFLKMENITTIVDLNISANQDNMIFYTDCYHELSI